MVLELRDYQEEILKKSQELLEKHYKVEWFV